eukprot:TRINITY_DN138448_c0_g1_i1.p1 TRINITY_DN138448_c0_g1~~TRINITY_DN138448_c0_g1_i1.p1  ORF type:complete len:476 (-),score=33.88 TRINITY_DN138448_c0_g1_i1:461-1888(-)
MTQQGGKIIMKQTTTSLHSSTPSSTGTAAKALHVEASDYEKQVSYALEYAIGQPPISIPPIKFNVGASEVAERRKYFDKWQRFFDANAQITQSCPAGVDYGCPGGIEIDVSFFVPAGVKLNFNGAKISQIAPGAAITKYGGVEFDTATQIKKHETMPMLLLAEATLKHYHVPLCYKMYQLDKLIYAASTGAFDNLFGDAPCGILALVLATNSKGKGLTVANIALKILISWHQQDPPRIFAAMLRQVKPVDHKYYTIKSQKKKFAVLVFHLYLPAVDMQTQVIDLRRKIDSLEQKVGMLIGLVKRALSDAPAKGEKAKSKFICGESRRERKRGQRGGEREAPANSGWYRLWWGKYRQALDTGGRSEQQGRRRKRGRGRSGSSSVNVKLNTYFILILSQYIAPLLCQITPVTDRSMAEYERKHFSPQRNKGADYRAQTTDQYSASVRQQLPLTQWPHLWKCSAVVFCSFFEDSFSFW